MKQIIVAVLSFGLCLQTATAQLNAAVQPVYFIDSVKVSPAEMKSFDPNDFVQVSVYKGAAAVKLIGADGGNGVVYIQTRAFANKSYWHLFSNKSPEYFLAIPDKQADSSVLYIVNDQVLSPPFTTGLSGINENNLIDIKIIDQPTLIKNYGINNKKYGVIVQYRKAGSAL